MSWILSIAAAVVALDQFTKWLVVRSVPVEQPYVVVDGFFQIVNWRNTGAAWGMFQGANLILAIVSLLTVIGLIVFRRSLHVHDSACRFALGLIAGGIVGNLIDRVFVKSVIDFLDFRIGDYRWPAFNVADSAICVGVFIYIIASWRADRRGKPAMVVS